MFREVKVSDVVRQFADLLDNQLRWDEMRKADPGLADLGKVLGNLRTYALLTMRVDIAPGAVTVAAGDPLVKNEPNRIQLPFRKRKLGGM